MTCDTHSPEETFKQFDTNVLGLLNVTRAVLPHMRARNSGTVVNISSIGGWRGLGGLGMYCTSKFAIEGISFYALLLLFVGV